METLKMSQWERRRLVAMSEVKSGKLSLVQASELLSVSYRQARRIWSRYQSEGGGDAASVAEGGRAVVAAAAAEGASSSADAEGA